ncbi:membrane protein [Streptomyces hygroscopicus]|uniref:streptophobe family protein n=1 Tax=Streptomyces hygroscopicus TaxID=1912 RepID=UPI00223F1F44|nr:streptophobe family protein [Streptomyces hygroscopicus]MCW7944675.1 membrane protein [Streptomyces hygroscopicus]
MGIGTAMDDGRLPWTDVLLSAIASVSWALTGMAGTAALGLHLLRADATGSLGPMTAAMVALGANGSVTPSGNVSAFGLKGAEAATAIEITPLGVSLVGALLLCWFILRSLRARGVVVPPGELIARAGAVVVLFVAMLGGLAWAGHDVITIDGNALGLGGLPGTGGGGGVDIPGLGNIGGLLPSRIGDLVHAKAAVGFSVDTVPTLLGGAGWAAGVLVIALLASRRTPLPPGWDAVHRVVRPAVSALVTVVLVAVAAGLAAALYAAIGDDHPARIAGAALLGAPNGVWLGVPLGLFVPWDGKATGELAKVLPDPLDRLLSVRTDQPVTLGRLAELDHRVWLLAVAAALMMLFAGVLTAARTPLVRVRGGASVPGSAPTAARDPGPLAFAGHCGLRLGVATALALPLLVLLTDVSVDASLSVLGFDAFGAGIELHGHLGMALLLGAAWGAGAGAAGALLACATGAAGSRAAPMARSDAGRPTAPPAYGPVPQEAGPYAPSRPYRPPNPDTNPYLRLPEGPAGTGSRQDAPGTGTPEPRRPVHPQAPSGTGTPPPPGAAPPPGPGDMYGAPTMLRPTEPPSRPPGRPGRTPSWPEQGPPPPPPPPGRPPGRG